MRERGYNKDILIQYGGNEMKKKRLAAAALASVMAVAGLAGCGTENPAKTDSKTAVSDNQPVDESGSPSPFGKYKEPVTVEIIRSVNPTRAIPEGESTTDNYYTRYVKDNINIDIKLKWQSSVSDFSQKVNLAIASNDLPDVMVVGRQEFKKLLNSDLIEDLTPYYDTYASDIVKKNIDSTDGKAMEAVTIDGKMYAIPGVIMEDEGYNLMWIRQDWLDKLDLEAPTTVEEVERVAKAFVDNQMGGENTIGLLGPTVNGAMYNHFLSPIGNTCSMDGIFQAYQSWPGFWIEGEDGKAIYGSTTPETKKALGKLQEMYKSGILDQELGVRKSSGEAWKSGKAGIMFSAWWHGYSVLDAIANDPEADWKAYPGPLAEDGKWYAKLGTPTEDYLVVRKGFEHPEAAFLLTNFLRRDEGKMTDETKLAIEFYPGRVTIAPNDECVYTTSTLRKYMNGEEIPEYDSSYYKLLDKDLDSLKAGVKIEPYDDMSISTWDAQHPNFGRVYSMLIGAGAILDAQEKGIVSKVFSLCYEQTPAMEKKWANLKKKEDEVFLKIMIGEAPLDSFDTFVEEWKAEGGDEITQEVQSLIAGREE